MNDTIAASMNVVLKSKLLIVSHLKPEFNKDGNQFYYIIDNLSESDCIVGFGETPMKALDEFCRAYGLKYTHLPTSNDY